MWLLLLEAFLAFMLLAFIVWWTMFCGRKPEAGVTEKQEHDSTETDRLP